jgi:hypothetical protein
VLDLARRAGLLEELLTGLFGPGQVWDLAADPPPASVPPLHPNPPDSARR